MELRLEFIEEAGGRPFMAATLTKLGTLVGLMATDSQIPVGLIYVTLVDDPTIAGVNAETRDIDSATDVLSFPMLESYGPGALITDTACMQGDAMLLGDILISADHMAAQAQEYGHSEQREFAFLAVHGMLHILGYDHMTPEDEKEMFDMQRHILEEAGITR